MRKLVLALFVVGCGNNQLTLHYKLDGIAPTDVVKVETRVDIDHSADARNFYIDQPFREVATGIGYEISDPDMSGMRTLLVTHDSTLGYVFAPTFEFRLLPPVNGAAPPLTITATAIGLTDTIGAATVAGKFSDDANVTIDLTDQRCGGVQCDPGTNQVCCNDTTCSDLQGDVANCGNCGAACGQTGDSCSGAACRCAGGSACAGSDTCCASVGCVDLQSDAFHCGDCDKACNPGESCVAGVCQCGSQAACAPSTLCCGDPVGCSPTGNSCPCGSNNCAFPEICCNMATGTCANTSDDNANCGACGNACTAPLTCANGACACNGTICATGDTCCSTGCANTDNDPNNCGGCGNTCASGETCSGGQCVCGSSMCTGDQLCCTMNMTSMCVSQSPTNCGACGHQCKIGEACTNDTCSCNGGGACTGNEICCPNGATGAAGGCSDPSNNPHHCGDCNTQCAAGDACVMGKCTPTPCDPPCMDGNTCVGGQCRCNGSGGCNNGQTCCTDGCKDLSSDPQNCNACGKKCAAGSYCCNGTCTAPNNANCTACGQACSGSQKCCVCGGSVSCSGLCLCL